jgi:hypothetical protein
MHESRCSRSHAILFGVCLVACGRTPREGAPVGPVLRVDPSSIDFGSVQWGETATASVTLRNDGDEGIDLSGLVVSSDALSVDDADAFHLGPGAEQVRTLSWTPVTRDVVREHLDVVSATRPQSVTEVTVQGTPLFGALQAWMTSSEVGAVGVGCEGETELDVFNEGSGELNVSITVDDAQFELVRIKGYSSEMPHVVAPHAHEVYAVRFVPATPGPKDATIHIVSDDPVAPVVDLGITALAIGPVAVQWQVPPRPTALTSLIDVNGYVAPYLPGMLDSFFDVLRDSGLPFRVAILGGGNDGKLDTSVAGSHAYIDDTLSAEETYAAADAMLDGISGDEDRGFMLLDSALAVHSDWLLGPTWASSALHLTVVNRDVEQSPEPADYYVAHYRTYKDDAGRVFVNGVAGELPAGCTGGPGSPWAIASPPVFDATQETGGVFSSICDDWSPNFACLAAAMVVPEFPLTDAAFDSSITVKVDGEAIESGWAYDAQRNAIRFDEDSYPAEGSLIEIEYGSAVGCD